MFICKDHFPEGESIPEGLSGFPPRVKSSIYPEPWSHAGSYLNASRFHVCKTFSQNPEDRPEVILLISSALSGAV